MSNEVTTIRREHKQVSDPIQILDTARFEHMQRIAQIMSKSNLIPESLYTTGTRDRKEFLPDDTVFANCFLIVNQAVRWEMDPFAVAQCTSVVKGKLCYEGKLVAAILDAKLGVDLDYVWNDAQGDAYGITVTGTLPNGKTKTIKGTVGDWKTTGDNSPWRTRNSQTRQLVYRGTREWARLFAPGTLLGVYTADEMDEIREDWRASAARDVTLPEPPQVPPQTAIAQQPPVAMQATQAARTAEPYVEMQRQEPPAPPQEAAKAPEQNEAPPPPPSHSEPPQAASAPADDDFPGDAKTPAQEAAAPDYDALIKEMAEDFAQAHTESDLLDRCDVHAERWYTNAPREIQGRAGDVFEAHRVRVVAEQQAKRRAAMQPQHPVVPEQPAATPPAPPSSDENQHVGDHAYWLQQGWDARSNKIAFNKPPGWLRDKDRIDDLEAWREGWTKHQLSEASK